MRRIFTVATCLWLGLAVSVGAQATGAARTAVVVELYTSQGCSSCPPADAILAQLVGRPGVIPLALHVDYWDYIGWADQFGSPVFTARQKAYARAAGSRTIYTPQMIIQGTDRVEGPRPMDVAELIQQHRNDSTPVQMSLRRDGKMLVIGATSTEVFAKKLDVQLVRYRPSATVSILRGENAGRRITYHNIVTEWRQIGSWDGASPLSMEIEVDGKLPIVVIFQKPGPGPILAAEQLK